jgi:outer membrane protein TolC
VSAADRSTFAHRRAALGLLLGGALVIGGCASNEDRLAAQFERAHQALLMSSQSSPTTAASDDLIIPNNAGADDYVQLALERNGNIAAARYRVESATARIPQATSLDDPMLDVSPIGEMAETASGRVGTMTSISQRFPFFGKLDTRGRIARQDVTMALADLRQARLSVIADTRRAYWSYYFAAQAIRVTDQTRQLLRQFQQIADARFRAGTASQSDVLRASTELSNLDSELLTQRQRQTTAAAMLNSLMDRPVTAPLPAPKPAELKSISLQLENLLARASKANPELARIRARIESERQRQKLAKLSYFPDLTVGLNYNFVDDQGLSTATNGKDQWWVEFGINIPIWFDKYRAGEREALHDRQAAIADLAAAKNRIAFQVQDALARVRAQQRQTRLFHDVIVPQAKQTLDASQAGYQAGTVDFLTLVDNWRNLLNYELMYHQNLAQLEKDFAEVQEMVGGDATAASPGAATQASPLQRGAATQASPLQRGAD